MTLRTAAAAAVLLALAAGCRGGSTGTARSIDLTSASAIAAALDKGGFTCTGWDANTDVLMAREDGTCQHGEEGVDVATYNGHAQLQQVEKFWKQAGLLSGVVVVGDAWSVSVDSAAEAAQVRGILGGSDLS